MSRLCHPGVNNKLGDARGMGAPTVQSTSDLPKWQCHLGREVFGRFGVVWKNKESDLESYNRIFSGRNRSCRRIDDAQSVIAFLGHQAANLRRRHSPELPRPRAPQRRLIGRISSKQFPLFCLNRHSLSSSASSLPLLCLQSLSEVFFHLREVAPEFVGIYKRIRASRILAASLTFKIEPKAVRR